MAPRRKRFRPWLVDQINSGSYPGLRWIDKESLTFRIPWKHVASRGFDKQRDGNLFLAWAVRDSNTQKFKALDLSTCKSRFRCALYKLRDIEKCSDLCLEGEESFRVYRFKSEDVSNQDLSDSSSSKGKNDDPSSLDGNSVYDDSRENQEADTLFESIVDDLLCDNAKTCDSTSISNGNTSRDMTSTTSGIEFFTQQNIPQKNNEIEADDHAATTLMTEFLPRGTCSSADACYTNPGEYVGQIPTTHHLSQDDILIQELASFLQDPAGNESHRNSLAQRRDKRHTRRDQFVIDSQPTDLQNQYTFLEMAAASGLWRASIDQNPAFSLHCRTPFPAETCWEQNMTLLNSQLLTVSCAQCDGRGSNT